MDNIYLLSLILCALVLLPVIFLVIKCSTGAEKSNAVLVYYYALDYIDDNEIQKIKELWWEEHFCMQSKARELLVISQELSLSDFQILKKEISQAVVLRPWQISDYLRKNIYEGTKTL